MTSHNGKIHIPHRNYAHIRVLPEVQQCMEDVLDVVVRRACYQTALANNSVDFQPSLNYHDYNQMTDDKIFQTGKTKEKKTKKRKTNPKNTQKNACKGLKTLQRNAMKQEKVCSRKDTELKKFAQIVENAEGALQMAKNSLSKSQLALKNMNERAKEIEELIASIPETKPKPKPKRTPPPLQPLPTPPPLLSDLNGPEHLIASSLPPGFPRELSYRALSSYALLRSLSLSLRLSPFTATSFLRALVTPIPTRLLGEVHVALLRYLFASIKVGTYEIRGQIWKDLTSKDSRGGNNLRYMDSTTWTLFFEDYAELSIEKYIADDDEVLSLEARSFHKTLGADEKGILKDDGSSTGKNIDSGENVGFHTAQDETAIEVEEVLCKDEEESEQEDEEDFYNERDVEEFSLHGTKKKAKKKRRTLKNNVLITNKRPSRGAKLEAVKRLKEANSDDEKLSASDDETSLSDTPTSRGETFAHSKKRKQIYSPSFDSTPTSTLKRKRGRPRKNPENQYAQSHFQTNMSDVNNSIGTEGCLVSDRVSDICSLNKKSPTVPPGSDTTNSNPQKVKVMKSDKNTGNFQKEDKTLSINIGNNNDTLSESRKVGRPRKNKRKKEEKVLSEKKNILEKNFQIMEKKTASRLPHNLLSPEAISASALSTAVNHFLSTPTQLSSQKHLSPNVEAKLAALQNIPHMKATKRLRHGQKYSELSLLTKLEILEFLIDEFLATFPTACELLHRHRITSYHEGKYGLLPSKTQLENLTNVDECVVCGIEGDLVCCDGCTASYHCKCANLPVEENLPEGLWLCPECRIPNPSKLGPLYGGTKCEIDWFSMKDFIPIVHSEKLSNSLSNLKNERTCAIPQPTIENKSFGESENKTTETIAKEDDQNKEKQREEALSVLEPEKSHTSHSLTSQLGNAPNTPASPSFNGNTLKLSNPNLRPSISLTDEREFLIIFGHVFTRRKQLPSANTPPSPPSPISQSELFELIRSLGIQYCLKWPWCQIPFDPFKIWEDLEAHPDENILKLLKEKQQQCKQHFLLVECHNPTAYENLYRKAILPPYITKKGNNVNGFRREESLRLHVVRELTYDHSQDAEYFKALFSHPSFYDPLQICKTYIMKLERILMKACLLNELWGINEQLIPNLWTRKVLKCTTVPKLAKLCIELIDSTHSRAFFEEWNRALVQTRTKQNDTVHRTHEILTIDWTPQKECRKRDWERSSYRDSLTLLRKEGNRIGGWMSGRKKKNIVKLELADLSLPTLKRVNMSQKLDVQTFNNEDLFIKKELIQDTIIEDMCAGEEANKKNETNTKMDLAMTPGAIRARERRKRERSEKERIKRDAIVKIKNETGAKGTLIELQGIQNNIAEEDNQKNVSEIKTYSVKEQPKAQKQQRKKAFVPLSNRRRSGRNISRPNSVEEAINSLTNGEELQSSADSGLVPPEKSLDFQIKKVRRVKIAALEKLLNKHADREPHWPICGAFYFPPKGSLPAPILKRLARNAGMKPAPYMIYSAKFEVAQPSLSHCWRKRMKQCKTIDELNLLLTVLESFMNRSTIHSCESLGRRSSHTKSMAPKVIRCSHYDPETGLTEHFVVNRRKNKGVWLSEESVDHSSLILELSNRIENQQNKFTFKLFEKRRKEREKQEEAENQIQKKRTAEESLRSARYQMTVIHNAIIQSKNEVVVKHQILKKNEEDFANAQMYCDEERVRLDAIKKEVCDEINLIEQRKEIKMKQELERKQQELEKKLEFEKRLELEKRQKAEEEKKRLSEAQLERAFMEYIDNDIHNMQHSQEVGRSGRSVGGKGKGKGRKSVQEFKPPLFSSFSLEESKYERAFIDAVKRHEEATKRLLKESSDLGLNTVPVKKMNAERIVHMGEMKKANQKLIMMNSNKQIDDEGLTKALAAAEDAGLQSYVNQAELEKEPSEPSMNYDESIFASSARKRTKGKNEKGQQHHLNPQAFRDDIRTKASTSNVNSIINFEQQVEQNMGALERQLAQQQQHYNQMNEQNFLSVSHNSLSQPDQSDYTAVSNALAQNLIMQQPRTTNINRQIELRNNIGQRISNEMNGSYLLDLERQSQAYQRDNSRSILENDSSSRDLYSAQLNNQMLLQSSQFGDNLIGDIQQQIPSRNTNFSTRVNPQTNFQAGNTFAPSLQAQQFSGQFSDTYTDQGVVGRDQFSVNNTPFHPLDNAFTQQVHQQHNPQSFMPGTTLQQRAQVSRNLSQNILPSNHSTLQNNGFMDYNLW